MMYVVLLLLLPRVDWDDYSTCRDDATNAAQDVFHHKMAFLDLFGIVNSPSSPDFRRTHKHRFPHHQSCIGQSLGLDHCKEKDGCMLQLVENIQQVALLY